MEKILYVDTELLEEKIAKSGIKIGFICETLALSRQGFNKKRRGITPFKAAEVYVLCDLLDIRDDERAKIFTPSVTKKVSN